MTKQSPSKRRTNVRALLEGDYFVSLHSSQGSGFASRNGIGRPARASTHRRIVLRRLPPVAQAVIADHAHTPMPQAAAAHQQRGRHP